MNLGAEKMTKRQGNKIHTNKTNIDRETALQQYGQLLLQPKKLNQKKKGKKKEEWLK